MKNQLEKLWNGYFAEECATIDTEEARILIKKVDEMRKALNELLTNDQSEAIEKYTEALYEFQSYFVRKAFFKGCEFVTSFFFELENFGNEKN